MFDRSGVNRGTSTLCSNNGIANLDSDCRGRGSDKDGGKMVSLMCRSELKVGKVTGDGGPTYGALETGLENPGGIECATSGTTTAGLTNPDDVASLPSIFVP